MTPQELDFLIVMIKEMSGISLGPEKQYLLESRLQTVARKHSFSTISEMVNEIRVMKDKKLSADVVEAMTTNESMFFRDTKPFDQIKNALLPHFLEHKKPGEEIKLWSAACSNGQEPYSVALTFLENPGKMGGHPFKITASDIAPKVVNKAQDGYYTQFEVQRGMPITMLLKYFDQQEGNHWKIKDEVRKYIQFKVLNLLDSYLSIGKVDMILCRNVLIYFEDELKKDIVERMHRQLHPHGVLMIGSSESITRITDMYKLHGGMNGVYVKA